MRNNGPVKDLLIMLLIFAAALSFRLASIAGSTHAIESDEIEYDRLAVSLAGSSGYISSDGTATSHRPPLYPAVLALFYRIFGHDLMIVRIFQAIAGGLTVILFYLMAGMLFNRTTAIITGVISSFYMPFVACANLLYTETFFTLLIALIAFLIIGTRNPSIIRTYAIGILCGLSTLVRSNGFIMIPVAMAAFLVDMKERSGMLNRALPRVSALLISFALVIAPWTIRNWVVHNRPVIISTNSGLNMYQALIKTPGKIYAIDPSDEVDMAARKASTETKRNDIYTRAAFGLYKNYPARALKMMALRFLFFFNFIDWEIMGGETVNYHFIFILPFALAGTVFAFKMKKDILVPLLIILLFISLLLIFPGTARYRMPVDGYIIMLGSYGIYEVVARQRRKIYPVLGITAYFFFTFFLYRYSIPTKNFIRDLMRAAGIW